MSQATQPRFLSSLKLRGTLLLFKIGVYLGIGLNRAEAENQREYCPTVEEQREELHRLYRHFDLDLSFVAQTKLVSQSSLSPRLLKLMPVRSWPFAPKKRSVVRLMESPLVPT